MKGSDALLSLPPAALVALGALAVLQIALDVIALVDLYKRPTERLTIANKWIWVAIILFISTIGAIVYLAAGRKSAPAADSAACIPSRSPCFKCSGPALRQAKGRREAMSAALEIRDITKRYGEKCALEHVDLRVEEGSIFGFLGPNGAGKTTTLRILTGLARPTKGTVRVLGHDVARAGNDVRAEIGFLPDVPGLLRLDDRR